MLDTILIGLMILFGVLLFAGALFDRLIFYYKKRPGRGYIQLAKPGVPRWLVKFYSNIELISFLGFTIVILLVAWRFTN